MDALVRGALNIVSGAGKLFMNQNSSVGACGILLLFRETSQASHIPRGKQIESCATLLLCLLDCEEEVSSLPLSQFPFLQLVVRVLGSLPNYILVLSGVMTSINKLMNYFMGFSWERDTFLLFIVWTLFYILVYHKHSLPWKN